MRWNYKKIVFIASVSALVGMLFSLVLNVTRAAEQSTKFMIGERVETTDSLNVRNFQEVSKFTLIGAQPTGTQGVIVDGPIFRDGYWWWKIDYRQDEDGWSVENYLAKTRPQKVIENSPPPPEPAISPVTPEPAVNPPQKIPYFWVGVALLFGVIIAALIFILKRKPRSTDNADNNFIIWR